MENNGMLIVGRLSAPGRGGLLRALMVLPLCLPVVSTGWAAASSLDDPVVFCQLPVAQTPTGARADGMLPADYGAGARLLLLEPDGTTVDLAPEFASACDPDVSFDGKRLLFAGQKTASDPWNIWEMQTDGTSLRQITKEELDARHPLYLATFYTITSSEPWYTILFVRDDGVLNETATAPGTSLYTVRLDGSERRRITFHPGNDRTPYLMQDGLLLFAGSRSTSESHQDSSRVGLFAIQTDGIDYASYSSPAGKRIQHMPTVTSDGTVIFVEADTLDWDGAGQLASVQTRRPHHSYRSLTGEADGRFHSPSALEDGTILVSRRLEGDVLRLVRFSPSEGVLDTVYGDPSYHALHARVVARRPEPDGRSSTVRPESPTGKLFCLDVYESDAAFAAVEPEAAKRVRVIEGLPRQNLRQPSESFASSQELIRLPRRLLGEAPVEKDGSFHIDIPADLPVQLQLLDADGLALASCDWIWVKQREFRGCIGCHEDPELTPPNRFVEAARRPATELTLPPDQRRTVSFQNHVLPLLRAYCLSCHRNGGAADESGLTMGSMDGPAEEREAYEELLATKDGLVDPGRARTSRLIWRLFGRATSRPWDVGAKPAEAVPTDHAEILTPEERAVFVEWIDLGAQWTSDFGEEDE
jgi:hypothetical protein